MSGHHSKHRPALKKIEPTTTKAQPRESGRGTPSSTSTMEDAKQQKERRLNELRKQINVDEVWKQVEANLSKVQLGIVPVPGWKTVRIFVSSTFKDFHQEREILVKQVFADLRAWCEERLLHLVDCDLRWGVPFGTQDEDTLRICLEEIDRCYKENIAPYFLNMTCKRIGWIPMDNKAVGEILDHYQLVLGLSVTEMEIVHAAYRIDNPNALFLIRDESFLEQIKDPKVRREFYDLGDGDDQELQRKNEEKLEALKRKIYDRFAAHSSREKRVVFYKCQYIKEDPPTENVRPKLELSEDFSKTVYDFFKERIARQYRVSELHAIELEPYAVANYHHRAFMNSLSEMFFGREDILHKINAYVSDVADSRPMVLTGNAGTGKTSIMANAAHAALEKLNSHGDDSSKVFFHFVGAVPKSDDLSFLLRRLLKEITPQEDLPENLDGLIQAVKLLLSHMQFESKVVIFVDAVNQLDNEKWNLWFPTKLSPNLRLICSTISLDSLKTTAQSAPSSLESQSPTTERFNLVSVSDLDKEAQKEIVTSYLARFNKKLHEEDQMPVLLNNAGSNNALWLSVACEEMRIFGDFRQIDTLISGLPKDPKGLLKMVLQRLEKESDAILLRSTLCLLEVSKGGLLENELIEILAQFKEEKSSAEEQTTDYPKGVDDRLPYMDWAIVYRNLRIFLRPFGNPSEGRLNLYHSILRDVVRETYLNEKAHDKEKDDTELNQAKASGKSEHVLSETNRGEGKDRRWWHKKLADYFSGCSVYERRVEEYPFHLLELKKLDPSNGDRYMRLLEEFLLDSRTLRNLFDYEFSGDLLRYWRECGDNKYNRLTEGYKKALADMRGSFSTRPQPSEESLAEYCELVSRLLAQGGHYTGSLELAKECLAITQKLNHEGKQEKLMYLYGHEAYLLSLILGQNKEQSHDQIKELQTIIKLHEEAIKIIKDLRLDEKDNKYKKHLGLQLIKIAYARGQIASRRNSFEFMQKRTDRKKALSEVEGAIMLFQSLNDHSLELEALLTKATLFKGDEKTQIEIYEATKERCQELKGENCPLMCRLCFNMGVVYGRTNDTKNAYKYHKQAYVIAGRIYGISHEKTKKYKDEALSYCTETGHSPEDIGADK